MNVLTECRDARDTLRQRRWVGNISSDRQSEGVHNADRVDE